MNEREQPRLRPRKATERVPYGGARRGVSLPDGREEFLVEREGRPSASLRVHEDVPRDRQEPCLWAASPPSKERPGGAEEGVLSQILGHGPVARSTKEIPEHEAPMGSEQGLDAGLPHVLPLSSPSRPFRRHQRAGGHKRVLAS